MPIDLALPLEKPIALEHFRHAVRTALEGIEGTPKSLGQLVNAASTVAWSEAAALTRAAAADDQWEPDRLLVTLLLLRYTSDVAMLEGRDRVRQYEYMDLSRRMGELWERLCLLCFDAPPTGARKIDPPTFADAAGALRTRFATTLQNTGFEATVTESLRSEYEAIWRIIESGHVDLTIDLHLELGDDIYAVDLKSAFGSNEKGNTNRLLQVAAVYRELEPETRCELWVRSEIEGNNAYLEQLRNSPLWTVRCGVEMYAKLHELAGFDLRAWMMATVDWLGDLDQPVANRLVAAGLGRYVTWP